MHFKIDASTYIRGNSSLIDAILKNQFLHVSLAADGPMSQLKFSGNGCGFDEPGAK